MSDRFDAAIEDVLTSAERYVQAKRVLDDVLGRTTDSYYTQHESKAVGDARDDFAVAFARSVRIIVEDVRNGR